MSAWIEFLKLWLPLAASAVGLISAVVGVIISTRAMLRIRRDEKLREDEATHRELQTEALIEALFGVDRKISEQANQLRTWVETRLGEQEKRFNEAMSTIVDRLAPTKQEAEQVRDTALREYVKTLEDEIRTKELVLAGVHRALSDLDSNRNLDEIRKDLKILSISAYGRGYDLLSPGVMLFIPVVGPLLSLFAASKEVARKDRERREFETALKEFETNTTQDIERLHAQRAQLTVAIA